MNGPSPFRDRNGLRWDGDAIVVQTTFDDHANVGGSIHGGLTMTMLDSVMGGVVIASLPEGRSAVTASLTVNFLAAAQPGDRLVARAHITRSGRQLAYVDGWLTGADEERRLATATGVFVIVDTPGR